MICVTCRSRDAVRPPDRAPAGNELRRPASPSPSAPRRTASRRSSARTTTRAFPARPACRPPMPGRSSPGWPARPTRIGLGTLVSPVTFRHPGNLAKVDHDRRRDERRTGRGRPRRGLERPRASPARPGVPADQGAGRPARGPARDPPRPLGRAGRLVACRSRRLDRGRRLPPEAGRRARPAADADRWGASTDPHRQQRVAAVASASPRGTPTSTTSPRRPIRTRFGGSTRSSTRPARPSGATRRTLTRSAMIGVLIGRDEAEFRDRIAAMTRTLGDDADADWLAERELRWIVGTPDRARETVERFAAAGIERIMLQDFLPWDLDMVDVMGEDAGRPGLTVAGSASVSPRRRRRRCGRRGRRGGSGRGSCRAHARCAR